MTWKRKNNVEEQHARGRMSWNRKNELQEEE
jgi:hypothetical protein